MARTLIVALCCSFVALGGAPAAADDSVVEVSRKDCKRLLRHEPRADVEYKPGVDVRGAPVAPADVPGSPVIKLPKTIDIPIGIDLEEKYGLGAGGKYTGEATIGTVSVRKGRVYWNGKLLGDAEQARIAEACRRTYGR